MFNSDKIRKLVKNTFQHCNIYDEDYHIDFGEDCFSIVITGKDGLFSDIVDELKDCFNNDVVLIRADKEGSVILDFDIPSDIGFWVV